MREILKKTILTSICIIVLGFTLLVLVYMLPTEPMKMNLQKSIEELHGEGDWPTLINGYSSSKLDNFTDSFMLSIAVYDNEEPVLVRAMKNYYASLSTEHLPTESFYAYLQGADCYGENYARYWHGYLVVLKPLLLLFSYSDLRILNTFCLILLAGYIVCMLEKFLFKRAGGVWGIAMFFLAPITLLLCLDMANMFYVSLGAMIVLLKRKDLWKYNHNTWIFFWSVGMVTSYMDFLTYPIITLGVPLVTYIMLLENNENHTVKISDAISSIIAWGLGYGVMWSAKWILASVISGENILLNALRQVKTRSGLRDAESGVGGRLEAIAENVRVLFQGIHGKMLLIGILVVCLFLIYQICKQRFKVKWKQLLMLCLVTALPLAWLFATSEHATMHSWFTYRNLIVSIYAIGMVPFCVNHSDASGD